MISIEFNLLSIVIFLLNLKDIDKNKYDTREDNHNKHTIGDLGCSWAAPLKHCLGAVFYLCFNIGFYILGKLKFSGLEMKTK